MRPWKKRQSEANRDFTYKSSDKFASGGHIGHPQLRAVAFNAEVEFTAVDTEPSESAQATSSCIARAVVPKCKRWACHGPLISFPFRKCGGRKLHA